jgi:ABC-type sugar transport system ATPase subunit
VIFVTHDQVEAMTLADKIVVLNDGRIEQVGSPSELYNRPATRFVGGFIGEPSMNFIDGVVAEGNVIECAGLKVPVPADRFNMPAVGTRVTLGVRAEDVLPAEHSTQPEYAAEFTAPLDFVEMLGSESLLFIEFGGQVIVSRMQRPQPLEINQAIPFWIDGSRVHLFDGESEETLLR